jgi:nucleoid-associated protein YgaU
LDDGIAALAGGATLLVLVWIGVGTATTAAAHLLPPGRAASLARRWSERISPAVARRTVTALVTTALAVGPSAAQAASAPPRATVTATVRAISSHSSAGAPEEAPDPRLDPGWAPTVPDLPVVHPRRPDSRAVPDLDPGWGAPERRRPPPKLQESVVVQRGDTLWQIAARHLGPDATDPQIAHAWHLWYADNRRVIGPDPDRLLPGQELSRPLLLPGGLP